jgi:hypothetical protein
MVQTTGEPHQFGTGAQRDSQRGKPCFDLLPTAPLRRLMHHYAAGAGRYGKHNWRKGMPVSQFYNSMMRHALAFQEGKTDEDHLAAIAWNAFGIIQTQQDIANGRLPEHLNDMPVDFTQTDFKPEPH